MRINTNLTALNTFTQYTNNNSKIKSSVEKLSSGNAINAAADNAAGLAISEKMRAQIRGLEKASTNAQDAISLVQTAEGSLDESTAILQRMRELAVQSASDTNENEIDREALQDEFSQLQEELNDIAKNTTFNKKNLLDGSLSQSTKTLTNTDLKNSGMTVDLGNAAAGTYNFSVTTKLESAAVAGKKPTSKEIVLGDSSSYFANSAYDNPISTTNGNVIELGANTAASSLLNGNYKLSAEYGDDGGITVTATGDNGQSFEAKISASELEALNTDTAADRGITMKFNAGADDAFNVSLGLTNKIASTENNFNTLASNISKISVSISGGVTEKDAEYGVYANLTGAKSVKLEAGMSSVSFDNGVKVNFDTLTASSVDTANEATMAGTLAGTGLVEAANADEITIAYSNLQAFDDSSITNSTAGTDFAITNNTGTLTATIGGKEYTVTPTAAQLTGLSFTGGTAGDTATQTLTFNDENGKAAFTVDVTSTLVENGTGDGADGTIAATAASLTAAAHANGRISNAGHNYATIFSASTTDMSATTASSFSVDESANSGLTFQVGANEGDEMTIFIDKMDANYLGVASSSVGSREAAASAIGAVDKAINQVSSQRAYLGAVQNRLDHKIANLDTSAENLTSAESQIRDVDMAKEMTNFTNANILSQAATAMLAQANSLPQGVLSLIG
jgi:flagellin